MADDAYDPIEVLTSGSFVVGNVRDPYPRFAERRAAVPIERTDVTGKPVPPEADGSAEDIFTAYRYEDVEAILRDAETFSSEGYKDVMGIVMGHTILEMDGGEHLRHRALVAQAFRPRVLERWESELIRPVVDELIDAFADRGEAELVREFTARFPIIVIAAMLGLPPSDHERFLRWSIELISVHLDWERGMAASRSLREYYAGILAERRAEPRDDLISQLVAAEIDGQRLTDEEILPFLNLLLSAGAETTYRSSGNLLYGLLTNPDQLDAVRKDRELVPQAIEEALRWEPPLLLILRGVTRTTAVSGVEIPEGATVVVNLGSANRDESRWEHPERFDIFRPAKQHLAFASGPHMCLGMHLARLEMRVALNALLDRLPRLRLDDDAEDVRIHGLVFRSPTRLPVRFDPITPRRRADRASLASPR